MLAMDLTPPAKSVPPMATGSPGDYMRDPPPSLQTDGLIRKPWDARSIALIGLFVLALFYTMYFMRAILLPLVLALLLSYLLRPIVRGFARIHIRPPFGAAIVLIGLVALIGYAYMGLPNESEMSSAHC